MRPLACVACGGLVALGKSDELGNDVELGRSVGAGRGSLNLRDGAAPTPGGLRPPNNDPGDVFCAAAKSPRAIRGGELCAGVVNENAGVVNENGVVKNG